MHPYQEQVNKLWSILKRCLTAKEEGYLIEAISLGYTLLEVNLRLLLTSKAGKNGQPFSSQTLDKMKFLMDLANLAKENGFIDNTLYEKLDNFNTIRKDAIHGLVQGRIDYAKIEKGTSKINELIGDIQSRWLTITFGEEKRASEN